MTELPSHIGGTAWALIGKQFEETLMAAPAEVRHGLICTNIRAMYLRGMADLLKDLGATKGHIGLEDVEQVAAAFVRDHRLRPKVYKPRCPYAAHADDCECDGMGGDR